MADDDDEQCVADELPVAEDAGEPERGDERVRGQRDRGGEIDGQRRRARDGLPLRPADAVGAGGPGWRSTGGRASPSRAVPDERRLVSAQRIASAGIESPDPGQQLPAVEERRLRPGVDGKHAATAVGGPA